MHLAQAAAASLLLARNAQALAPFPQTLAADSQLLGEFGLAHLVLMLEHEVLEIIFERQVLVFAAVALEPLLGP